MIHETSSVGRIGIETLIFGATFLGRRQHKALTEKASDIFCIAPKLLVDVALQCFARYRLDAVRPHPKLGALGNVIQREHALVAVAKLRRIFDFDAADKGWKRGKGMNFFGLVFKEGHDGSVIALLLLLFVCGEAEA